jgi:hypothetical protein
MRHRPVSEDRRYRLKRSVERMTEHLIALLGRDDLYEHVVCGISWIHDDAAVTEHLISGVLHAHLMFLSATVICVGGCVCQSG